MQAVRSLLQSPWRLFLALAVPFGLLFLVVSPPFGGGDEQYHFQRTYEVASWQFLHEGQAPAGFVAFWNDADAQLPLHAEHKMTYSDPAVWQHWNAIALNPGHRVLLPQSILSQHYPLTYLLPALAMRAGLWLQMKPLWLLYLCRLASFAGSIALMAYAIAIAPRHAYLLACVALLPTMVFLRGYLIGDGVEIGLCYVFIMLVWRGVLAEGRLPLKEMVAIALFAAFAAQCKNAYMFLPCIVWLIPRARFASQARRIGFFAVSFLPGLMLSALWMWHERMLHTNLHYDTWGGHVYVDGQIQYVLHHPLTFGVVLLRTFFMSPMPLQMLVGLLGEMGWMDVHLPAVMYGLLACGIACVVSTHPPMPAYSRREKMLYAALLLVTILFISVVLYAEWTGYKSSVIKGWMGRYLYPLLPLCFAFLRTRGAHAGTGGKCGAIVALIACVSLPIALYMLAAHYYL
jgi:uncharacterized membrane protein